MSDREATRRSYDAVAGDYIERIGGELSYKPMDRAILAAIIERTGSTGTIADVGCGPGHVASWLAENGATAIGIDLSEGMIAAGRRAYPNVEFRQGDFLALPAEDHEFGALVALYSIIHLDPDELVPAFREMRRVLAAQGLALIAFHMGSKVEHSTEWWGHDVDLDFRFLEPDEIAKRMEEAGFVVEMRMERANYPEEFESRRAYLLARA